MNSGYVFSQDVPTYEEASSPSSYSTDITSNFSNTRSKEVNSPTHQPLNQDLLDTCPVSTLRARKKRNA